MRKQMDFLAFLSSRYVKLKTKLYQLQLNEGIRATLENGE